MCIFQLDFLTLWLISTSLVTWVSAAPQPDANGLCFSYIIQQFDTCASIGKAHGITEANIEKFNVNTWSWLGCKQLYQGDFICLSTGKPPMPMALPQATCGPQVPGTVRPAKWADLAGLNPCPAPKCCSWWGACSNTKGDCERSARAPPAGETATVKAPTVPPKKTGSKATATAAAGTKGTATAKKAPATTKKPQPTTKKAQPTTKSDVKKPTTKTSTTRHKLTRTSNPKRPTTTKKSITKHKLTRTTNPKRPTTIITTGTALPTEGPFARWEFILYSKKDCKGDYYYITGYNRGWNDTIEECNILRGGLDYEAKAKTLSCKWFTNGGLTATHCDNGTLDQPASWIVRGGSCDAYREYNCDCDDHYRTHYYADGCTNRRPYEPKRLNSFMCARERSKPL